MASIGPDIELGLTGLRVRGYPLWLDAPRPQALAFVSHAHSDHIARHAEVIATAPTIALMEHRLGPLPSVRVAPYRQAFTLGPFELELFPAGHILGSAQLRITRGSRRVVYTGDFNRTDGASSTAEPLEVAHCEALVMESTFGHPLYRFPPRGEVLERLRRFVERCFQRGQTPIVLGYSLGKAQEAVKTLGEAGFALCAHPSISTICEIFRHQGVPLPAVRTFDGSVREREVLLLPPNLRRAGQLAQVPAPRSVMLTGWALGAPPRGGAQADELLPLSDHADYPTLINYALETGAKQIFTIHGFCAELARALRMRGIDARPLRASAQLELF